MKNSIVSCALVLAAVSACGSSETGSSNGDVGGTSGGGSPPSGGASSNTGGLSSATGGIIHSGGATSNSGGAASGGAKTVAGGAEATGGKASGGTSVSPGGTSAAGGKASGGTSAAPGGTTAAGGKVSGGTSAAPGGATATGGKASGGTTAAGGSSTPGGKSAIGGTTSQGGASVVAGTSATGGSSAAGTATGGSTTVGGAAPGCTPPTTYENFFVTLSGKTQEQVDTKVSTAWSTMFNPSGSGTIYSNGPGSDESYVRDTYNNDVRSEGMSYGMMVAVQLDHQTEFDRLWTWVRNHMAQGCTETKCTGEIVWSRTTSGGSNGNTGGAPDGEEYFATALIFAHNRWGDTSGKFKYGTEAQWVLDVIRTKYFHTNPHLVKFLSSSGNTDASYVLPAFYQVWACFDTANAEFWNTAVKDARTFFHSAVDSNGVCPDQSTWTGGTVKGPTADWVRCVVNIMMDHNFFNADPWQTETYAPKFAAHEKNVGAGAQGFCSATLAMGLPAADGKAFTDKFWSANIPSRDYWNGTLYMLALLHLSGNFKLYY